MLLFHHIPSRRLGSNSTSHLSADRNVTYNRIVVLSTSHLSADRKVTHNFLASSALYSTAQFVVILFVIFSSDVIISPYPLKMSPQNSASPQNAASHLTLPRTQACFPRPFVAFCLSDGISLTASAYRGIRSNANSADRNVTHNLVVLVSSVKLNS